jgi:hypothetical protein
MKEVEKSCDNCKYDLGGIWCAKHPCHNKSNFEPKETDQVSDLGKKPKKLEYIEKCPNCRLEHNPSMQECVSCFVNR